MNFWIVVEITSRQGTHSETELPRTNYPGITMISPSSSEHECNMTVVPLLATKPKRPLTAYNIFFKDQRQLILSQGDSGGFAALARTIAARWKEITTQEYEAYCQRAAADKIRYVQEMRVWSGDENFSTGGRKKTKRKWRKVISATRPEAVQSLNEAKAATTSYEPLPMERGEAFDGEIFDAKAFAASFDDVDEERETFLNLARPSVAERRPSIPKDFVLDEEAKDIFSWLLGQKEDESKANGDRDLGIGARTFP